MCGRLHVQGRISMINCAYCGAALSESKPHLYDEHSDRCFCSKDCLREWADDHFDIIFGFYARLNVSQ